MARQLSYSSGPTGTALCYSTFPDLLDQKSRDHPDKEAHVFRISDPESDKISRRTVTFGDLADTSLKLASGLLNLGLREYDRVAIFGGPSAEWLYVEYATYRIKVLLMRLPPSLLMSSESFSHFLNMYNCKALFFDPGKQNELVEKFDALTFGGLLGGDTVESLRAGGIRTVDHLISLRPVTPYPGIRNLDCVYPTDPDLTRVKYIQSTIDPDEVAITYPTSGTTGIPKVVAHSHFSFINMVYNCREFCQPESLPIYMDSLPFFWLASFINQTVVYGTTQVHLDVPMQHPDLLPLTLRVCDEERVNSLVVSLFMLHDLNQRLEAGTLKRPPSLKAIQTGGEKIPNDLCRAIFQKFEHYFIMYGSTECPPTAINYRPGEPDPSDEEPYGWYKPYPNCQVKIADDSGRPVPIDTIGDIYTRGPSTSLGYLNSEGGITQIHDKAKWVKIGDVGIMNDLGHFRVLGRISDVISRSGSKIHPGVVEKYLMLFCGVGETVVVGVPDRQYHEEVCALLVPRAGCSLAEEELRIHCEGMATDVGMTFTPKYYLIMETFPKLPNGKVNRNALKALAKDKFGQ